MQAVRPKNISSQTPTYNTQLFQSFHKYSHKSYQSRAVLWTVRLFLRLGAGIVKYKQNLQYLN